MTGLTAFNTGSEPGAGHANSMVYPKLPDGSVPAAIPADEEQRLVSLRSFCILDTTKDPRFDRITRLAAELLDVPVVLLSLVDAARQWFKSTVGTGITEIERNHGFCAHAILLDAREPMVVPDTLDDARFATHPFVIGEPMLRFYAGAPLVSAQGRKIGTLCVHDVKPRHDFDDRALRILSQLADIAMDEIEFFHAESERELLVGELSHRVKNSFALIGSVAEISSRGHPGAAEFVGAFRNRLHAMSAAHDRLVSSDWSSVDLAELVDSVLTVHQDDTKNRIQIELPDLPLDTQSAQTLALLLHELLTNAVKYGALSVPSGMVFLVGTSDGVAAPNVRFEWRESGGPPAVAPARTGFGMTMLNLSSRQNGGAVAFDWRGDGLICRFEICTSAKC